MVSISTWSILVQYFTFRHLTSTSLGDVGERILISWLTETLSSRRPKGNGDAYLRFLTTLEGKVDKGKLIFLVFLVLFMEYKHIFNVPPNLPTDSQHDRHP